MSGGRPTTYDPSYCDEVIRMGREGEITEKKPKRVRNLNPVRERTRGYSKRFNRGGSEGVRDRKFWLSPGDRNFMFEYQQGQCGICKRHESKFSKGTQLIIATKQGEFVGCSVRLAIRRLDCLMTMPGA